LESTNVQGALVSMQLVASEISESLEANLLTRLEGPATPNSEVSLRLPRNLRYKELWLLCIVSWELRDCTRIILQDRLRRIAKRDFSDMSRLALTSKEGALTVLQNSFSERDFYGNSLGTLRRLLSAIAPMWLRPPRAKVPQRRRGYRNSTSRQRSPLSDTRDHTLRWPDAKEQNELEERRRSLEDLFQSFWGWAKEAT
jgi:hypothetical protein